MSSGRLTGKAALVTGGGRGIGRAVCQVFAKEGASVAVLDIDENGIKETIKLLQSDQNNKHCAVKADVSSLEHVEQALKTAQQNLDKQITILVNCAGILKGTTIEEFDEVIKVNLKGTFLMSQKFVASLKNSSVEEETRGIVVNLSSIAGIRASVVSSTYSASKFGVIGLTKTMALEFQKHRVRFNAVLPDMIDTLMLDGVDKTENAIGQNPMQRLGKAEEVANVCLFLASDESSYVNGACIEVTGGNRC
uniref:estradiol 17-beta-dehydrogenase 8-like n=1 Tax=Styela clava TaxID=7725 RepID=UPI001939D8C4|nr:estradiol 17-beta-dehydrogenase 8-like [Styela clava]